ncbi:MAG: hypothetical protein R3A80_00820 [Bdellovibrionota bacterium]
MKIILKNSSKTGQAIAEYLILSALIAIASIGIIQVISQNMRGKLNQVNGAIIGKDVQFQGNSNTNKQTQAVDMGNFNETLKDAD